jgi:7-cyano-7-deazaguanine reductase
MRSAWSGRPAIPRENAQPTFRIRNQRFYYFPSQKNLRRSAPQMKRARKHKYAGLTLLGNSQAAFPASPQKAKIETFPNAFPQRNYWIKIDSPEFTSLCPVTGQPDFAEIYIHYVPDQKCVETKSLKLYLSSYRNVHSFNEEVVNRILDDLVTACRPRRMRVEGKFVSRGGLSLSIVAEHPDVNGGAQNPKSP